MAKQINIIGTLVYCRNTLLAVWVSKIYSKQTVQTKEARLKNIARIFHIHNMIVFLEIGLWAWLYQQVCDCGVLFRVLYAAHVFVVVPQCFLNGLEMQRAGTLFITPLSGEPRSGFLLYLFVFFFKPYILRKISRSSV